MISNACKYGIRALVFVASKSVQNRKLGITEIASAVDAPAAFTAKILQNLSKRGIISSLKGPYGGFYMTPAQIDQPVLNIVEAIDGMHLFRDCALGLNQCSELHPCPMHHTYKQIREQLLDVFRSTSIAELAECITEGSSFIKNALLDAGAVVRIPLCN